MSKRKAFNFFRSYYEVANELSDKDRLAFYDAIIKAQLTGEIINLDGMAKFAFLSQKHSIESQIQGYFNKTKDPDFINILEPLKGASVGAWQGASVGGSVQEKEKEKEKEKEVNNKRVVNKFTAPTEIEVIGYFLENGYTEASAKKAFQYYETGNWKDSRGQAVKNWKQKIQSVWFKDENKVVKGFKRIGVNF